MILSRNAVCTLRGARSLSTRASSILSALDIPIAAAELPGVYDGQWYGSGEVFESVCPTTGEVLARVRSVSRLAANVARRVLARHLITISAGLTP